MDCLKRASAIAGMIISAAITVVIIMAVWMAVFDEAIIVGSIRVPPSVASNGFTDYVAAMKLRDVVNQLVNHAKSTMKAYPVVIESDIPDMIVPKYNFSIQSIAALIRYVLKIRNREAVAGAIYVQDEKLFLELQVNGAGYYVSSKGVDGNEPAVLFNNEAAAATLRFTEPYILASTEYQACQEENCDALQILDGIIENASSEGQTARAYNLKGLIFHSLGYCDQALDAFESGIAASANFSYLYANLADLLMDLGQQHTGRREAFYGELGFNGEKNLKSALCEASEAKKYYSESEANLRKAIELDPHNTNFHNSLGTLFDLLGRGEQAVMEHRKANPNFEPEAGGFVPMTHLSVCAEEVNC
jgi:hypothetical protein